MSEAASKLCRNRWCAHKELISVRGPRSNSTRGVDRAIFSCQSLRQTPSWPRRKSPARLATSARPLPPSPSCSGASRSRPSSRKALTNSCRRKCNSLQLLYLEIAQIAPEGGRPISPVFRCAQPHSRFSLDIISSTAMFATPLGGIAAPHRAGAFARSWLLVIAILNVQMSRRMR